jgi:diguanylate cyclase (GGDEF)-like protein
VIWVDVDNFQLVNDSFGQRVGDDVLRQVSATLRRVASGAGLVARNTGDEFLIVIGDHSEAGDGSCAKVEDVAQIAQSIAGRVRAAFRSPFDAAGADVFLRPCVGVSVLPVHAQDRDGLLRHADIAKDQTKAALRSGAPGTRGALAPLDEISLTTRLHRALDQGEFVLHYQPVVNIDSGDLVSVEALLRWQDPEHGLVSPGEFIPLAERIGMIGPLTDWVVEEASRQAARWHAQGLVIGVAVNVPAILWHPAAADRLIETVRRHGVDPRLFVVEVTESTAMADPAVSDRVLKRLSDAGLHLAIDDFGTGYSSLSRLRELPASTLKIDRSFVSELGTDPSADVMVQTVVGMARSLGLRPLAEGIETEQQRRILLAHGCRLGQGFLFSRPLPASEISRSCALRPAA